MKKGTWPSFLFLLLSSSMSAATPRRECYAAARNKLPLLEVLKSLTPAPRSVLEVSSGTGEHAETFLSHLPTIQCYQPTELDVGMFASITDWTSAHRHACRLPIKLDVTRAEDVDLLETGTYDFLININMIHISPPETTGALFDVSSKVLSECGRVLTYGPYRVSGEMVESNHAFDLSLKARDPSWGVRDLEWVASEAEKRGFVLESSQTMPANNLANIWRRKTDYSTGDTKKSTLIEY